MGNLTVKESGEMVNIISPNVNNITSFKVHFSPKQEGSGDPSPENVREITGWNGVEGYGSGKNIGRVFGYSATNLSDTTNITAYKATNAYGTTISTTTFNLPDTELVVTQSQATEPTSLSSYRNGYIVIGIDNLIFEQTYNVSFKISNITNNLLDTTLDNIRLLNPYGSSYSASEIIGDRVIFKNVLFRERTATPDRKSFEIRICGFSFTLSEFMVTSVDDEDFTYEPYQGTESNINWTNNIKQWTYIDSSFDTYATNVYNGYGNSLWDNAITDIPAEWFGKTLTYSIYIDRAESPYNSYDNARVWFYNDSSVTMQEAKKPCRITEASSSGRSWVTFTIPEGTTKIGLGLYISKGGRAYNPQLEYGEEPTEYQPYVGDVYGGYVDLVSGELVSSWICSKIKDLDGAWNYKSGNTRFQIYLQSNFAKTDSTAWSKFAIAEAYKKSTSNGYANGQIATYVNRYIYIRDDSFDGDVEAFLEAVGDTKVAYELAESTTYQLTSQQLSTLKGQNNFWSNADYVEIEYELTETFDIQKAKRKIILNQPHVESASGDIITFDTDMKGKLKECKVYFSPVQEGEGDPSPENVREITGWNGVSVELPSEYQEVEYVENTKKGGVNQYINTNIIPNENMRVYMEGTTNDSINDAGFLFGSRISEKLERFWGVTWLGYYKYGFSNNSNRSISSAQINEDFIFDFNHDINHSITVNGTTKIPTIKTPNTYTYPIYIFGINNHGKLDTVQQQTFKIKKFRIYNHYNDTTPILNFIPCYRKSDNEIGMYDTVSKQFFTNQGTGTFLKGDDVNSIQASIDWTDSAGTVYGGYVDLISGELVVNMVIVDLGTLTWMYNEQYTTFVSYPIDLMSISAYKKGLCSQYRITDQWLTSQGWASDDKIFSLRGQDGRIRIKDTAYTDASAFKTSVDGVQFVYELANPIHYQLTPQQLIVFKGTNNIFSDSNGTIDIKFWTHNRIIDYLKDAEWLDHYYITSAGKLTSDGNLALSHVTTTSIYLPKGRYNISGFCNQEYVTGQSLNCRVHEYDANDKWVKLIINNEADFMSDYSLEFSLDHDSYIKLSLPRMLECKLIKLY